MKDDMNSRFTGGPLTLHSFQDSILVECPHCQQRAEVVKNSSSGQREFHCYNCHRTESNRTVLHTLSVNQYCPDCDYRVEAHIPAVRQKTAFIRLQCHACGHTNKFTPTYESFVVDKLYDGEVEPYFGNKLWLQTSFGSDTFWAYNYAHLQHLQEYIQAVLRERQARTFSPMVERLPVFIKSAKNRAALLASIKKLALKK